MDIAEFRVIRSPRAPGISTPGLGDTGFVPALVSRVDTGPPLGPAEVEDLIATTMVGQADPIAAGDLANPDSPLQCVYRVLAGVDEILDTAADRIEGKSVYEGFKKLADAFATHLGAPDWKAEMTNAGDRLLDWVAIAVFHQDFARAADLTRLWALLRLLERADLASLSADEVWLALNGTVPHLPASLSVLFQVPPAIELVREASVADLFVVRQEWRTYVRGDIAGIKNVLPGEVYEKTLKRTEELESTQAAEVTQSTSSEDETRTQEDSELSRETVNQLRAEISGGVRTDVQQSWGVGSVKVSGGIEGRLSIDQAERQASRIARSATKRAVSRVDSMTREARTRRELSRTEDTVHEELSNTKTALVRGIYRWLDRIDRYQIVRYPDRLQLEFQLPEPGEYLRWRNARRKEQASAGQPPAWNVKLSEISEDADNLSELAQRFRATNLPSPPPAEVSVVTAIKAEAKGTPTGLADAVPVPMANEECELLVPGGYEATEIQFSGLAVPVFGKWAGERADGKNWTFREGYHGSVLTVAVAGKYFWASNQRNGIRPNDAVPRTLGIDNDFWPRFGDAMTELNAGTETTPIKVDLAPHATAKVKLAVQGAGVSAAHVSFLMKCVRTSQALATWRQGVYDALFEAWSKWKADWDAEQNRAAELQLISGEGSASKVEEILRTEVKRQVIAWLLKASPFQGMNALAPAGGDKPPVPWREIDFALARAGAPTIQFMEQAFEWGNLSYILYPYYWADRTRWDALNEVQSANPDYERFLKAGSARVVVPARPAMTQAVLHWLVYRRPFLGRPLPLPGDPLYISLAQEIRDLTQPPPDGIPGDSWEVKIGTSLLWLEDTDALPVNEVGVLGQPPHEPQPRLSPVTP